MRILFCSSIFPRPHAPNRGIYCLHQCEALAGAGHEVRVVSPRSWREKRVDASAARGLAAFKVEYPTYFYPPGVMRSAYGWFMWMGSRRCVRRTVSEFSPDCVLSYWIHPDGEVAVRAAGEAGVPCAVIVGGSDLLILARQPGRRRRRILDVLHGASAVITVGAHLRERAIELGVPGEKVHVVYQGIDGKLFSPGDQLAARGRLGLGGDEKVLVFVGNLLPVKGVDVLLEACALLRARGVAFRLCLIGGGASRGELEAQSRALGLGDVVRFVGAVPQRELPDWYRAADVTVLPSRSEGVPNVLRESAACGRRFVATDVGGVREVAVEGMSRLVPRENPGALAEAIAASLAEGPEPSVCVLEHSWAGWAHRVMGILGPLVSRKFGEAAGIAMPGLGQRGGVSVAG